jgi:geranylgeranyl pyrophosphate synthase
VSVPDTAVFDRTLDAWRAGVDAALRDISVSLEADDPVSGAMRYALAASGKRLRPVLCLAAMDAVAPGAVTDGAPMRAAAAIELVHTYSLVHDDLPCMDDDDMRRGRATAHRVFGTRAAMVAGFGLIPLACSTLDRAAATIGADPATRARAVRELCQGAGAAGMVGGQALDLAAEHHAIERGGLTAIHRMKTGALFRASLRVGALLAGAAPPAVDALGRFGERLGLAFQITDDVLDVTSRSEVLGKTAGKDIDADKATFVSLLGVEGAATAARAEADGALDEIGGAGLRTPLLEGLVGFAVHRDR